MADKPISELIAATQVTPSDMFVLEQSGTAKKLSGQTLENWLLSFANGHGGIQKLEKVGTDGLVDTYRITFADTTVFDYVVTNGRSVDSIRKTSTSGLVDTYSISYNDGTVNQFTVTNGAKGDKGDNTYLWIKYASQQPTASSHSFGDEPDAWIGIYYGSLESAPASWDMYRWSKIKGDAGDTGAAATLLSSSVTYQVSASGTVVPSGTWSDSVPSVAQGSYLWTRVITTFNSGSPIISYSVSRMGIDGTGTVVSVNTVSPDINGDVNLTADKIAISSTDATPVSEALNRRQTVVTSDIDNGAVTNTKLATSAVSTDKLADAAVTRAKLAQDALYSPFVTAEANTTIGSEHIGKKLRLSKGDTDYVINVQKDSTIPEGSEIGIYKHFARTGKIIFASNIKVALKGESAYLTAPTVSIVDTFTTIAIEKLGADSTYDYWHILGDVEVDK